MSWNRNLLLGLSQNEYLSAKWLGGIQGAIDKISGQSVNVVSRQNSPLINLKIFLTILSLVQVTKMQRIFTLI